MAARAEKTERPGIYRLTPSRRFPNGGWMVRYRESNNATNRKTFETSSEAIAFQRRTKSTKEHPEPLHRLRKGAISETRAVTWLLEQGYEVFPNVAATGPIDLVAIRGPSILLVDVKSEYQDGKGRRANTSLKPMQREMGVRLLVVGLAGECYWADEPLIEAVS